ncbi:Integral membrane protein [Tritrichomonas foetus]|uniref:Integral membrane protein n=1 Tax=Tritrichomonas foetus TaxID=1144522 RepID=A0A1J4JYC4_9EUKA|nr:Integral membrane protein [Tritrichomonas foetus]|eukprot:OHT03995.1 Integral membrane protein [Tritrichomonas foetus]
MRCTFPIVASFIFCAVAYGASSAAVTQGLKYFTPELIIVFRMLFGCGFCIIVLIFRMIFQEGYTSIVKAHFTSGFWPIFHLSIGGLLNLGIPHSLIAIAQQWIPSAAVQMAKPLTPAVSQICSHFLLPDERFTWLKFAALMCAVVGVTCTAIPSFLHTVGGDDTVKMAIGFILLIISVSLFGVASVYFKFKTPNTDITISSMMQTGVSFVFDIIWSLIMDGPQKIYDCCRNAGWIGWIWPLMLGILASGVAVHGFMYLVNNLGAVGANFVPFAQILVGVTLGVAWLHEWAPYRWWEIVLSSIGLVFLTAAIVIGFWHGKEKEPKPDQEEEEELHSEEEEEDKNAQLDEV